MTKPYPTIEEVLLRHDCRSDTREDATPSDIIRIACDLDRERQVESAERAVWARYPWATCAAKNENGQVVMHEKPATCRVQFWSSPGKQVPVRALKIPGPWQESLRARPEGV